MEELRPGERLVRCLLGQPVDRIPFGIGFGWQPWGDALERWRAQTGLPELDITEYFGYDPGFVLPELQCGIWPPLPAEIISRD
ncbi:MAG: hypothetical protein ACYC6L_11805, partial [Anaerolineae bacterium]